MKPINVSLFQLRMDHLGSPEYSNLSWFYRLLMTCLALCVSNADARKACCPEPRKAMVHGGQDDHGIQTAHCVLPVYGIGQHQFYAGFRTIVMNRHIQEVSHSLRWRHIGQYGESGMGIRTKIYGCSFHPLLPHFAQQTVALNPLLTVEAWRRHTVLKFSVVQPPSGLHRQYAVTCGTVFKQFPIQAQTLMSHNGEWLRGSVSLFQMSVPAGHLTASVRVYSKNIALKWYQRWTLHWQGRLRKVFHPEPRDNPIFQGNDTLLLSMTGRSGHPQTAASGRPDANRVPSSPGCDHPFTPQTTTDRFVTTLSSAEKRSPIPSASLNLSADGKLDASSRSYPVCLIQPPDALGFSFNRYTTFPFPQAQKTGLVWNNSSSPQVSQWFGTVPAGLPVGQKPAKFIIVDVLSSENLPLGGAMEVLGDPAHLILMHAKQILCRVLYLKGMLSFTLTSAQLQRAAQQAWQIEISPGEIQLAGPCLRTGESSKPLTIFLYAQQILWKTSLPAGPLQIYQKYAGKRLSTKWLAGREGRSDPASTASPFETEDEKHAPDHPGLTVPLQAPGSPCDLPANSPSIPGAWVSRQPQGVDTSSVAQDQKSISPFCQLFSPHRQKKASFCKAGRIPLQKRSISKQETPPPSATSDVRPTQGKLYGSSEGAPCFQINAPDEQGVSINQYSALPFQRMGLGLVWNNSTQPVHNEAFGVVPPGLPANSAPAKMIVVALVAESDFLLPVRLEVLGHPAQLVFVHPWRIIYTADVPKNIPRLSLVTGRLQLDAWPNWNLQLSKGTVCFCGDPIHLKCDLDVYADALKGDRDVSANNLVNGVPCDKKRVTLADLQACPKPLLKKTVADTPKSSHIILQASNPIAPPDPVPQTEVNPKIISPCTPHPRLVFASPTPVRESHASSCPPKHEAVQVNQSKPMHAPTAAGIPGQKHTDPKANHPSRGMFLPKHANKPMYTGSVQPTSPPLTVHALPPQPSISIDSNLTSSHPPRDSQGRMHNSRAGVHCFAINVPDAQGVSINQYRTLPFQDTDCGWVWNNATQPVDKETFGVIPPGLSAGSTPAKLIIVEWLADTELLLSVRLEVLAHPAQLLFIHPRRIIYTADAPKNIPRLSLVTGQLQWETSPHPKWQIAISNGVIGFYGKPIELQCDLDLYADALLGNRQISANNVFYGIQPFQKILTLSDLHAPLQTGQGNPVDLTSEASDAILEKKDPLSPPNKAPQIEANPDIVSPCTPSDVTEPGIGSPLRSTISESSTSSCLPKNEAAQSNPPQTRDASATLAWDQERAHRKAKNPFRGMFLSRPAKKTTRTANVQSASLPLAVNASSPRPAIDNHLASPIRCRNTKGALSDSSEGFPCFQINAPDDQGVSINQYSALPFQRMGSGSIWNNSTQSVRNEAFGVVPLGLPANSAPAKVIIVALGAEIDCVLSACLEVLGHPAQVIFLHPGRIIYTADAPKNIPRLSLVTGQLQWETSSHPKWQIAISNGVIGFYGKPIELQCDLDLYADALLGNRQISANNVFYGIQPFQKILTLSDLHAPLQTGQDNPADPTSEPSGAIFEKKDPLSPPNKAPQIEANPDIVSPCTPSDAKDPHRAFPPTAAKVPEPNASTYPAKSEAAQITDASATLAWDQKRTHRKAKNPFRGMFLSPPAKKTTRTANVQSASLLLAVNASPPRAAINSHLASPIRCRTTKGALYDSSEGFPCFQINAPDSDGVSINQYARLPADIARMGLVWNNSHRPQCSRSWGTVPPSLCPDQDPAKVIVLELLSEPTFCLPVRLELLGSPAQLIIVHAQRILYTADTLRNIPRLSLITGCVQCGKRGDHWKIQRTPVTIAFSGFPVDLPCYLEVYARHLLDDRKVKVKAFFNGLHCPYLSLEKYDFNIGGYRQNQASKEDPATPTARPPAQDAAPSGFNPPLITSAPSNRGNTFIDLLKKRSKATSSSQTRPLGRILPEATPVITGRLACSSKHYPYCCVNPANAHGISINRYVTWPADKLRQGIVWNHSETPSIDQWFGDIPADGIRHDQKIPITTILAEIMSGDCLRLHGQLAVLGEPVHLIVVHPKAIHCQALTFHNIAQLSLITGSVVQPESKNWKMKLSGGSILFDPDGITWAKEKGDLACYTQHLTIKSIVPARRFHSFSGLGTLHGLHFCQQLTADRSLVIHHPDHFSPDPDPLPRIEPPDSQPAIQIGDGEAAVVATEVILHNTTQRAIQFGHDPKSNGAAATSAALTADRLIIDSQGPFEQWRDTLVRKAEDINAAEVTFQAASQRVVGDPQHKGNLALTVKRTANFLGKMEVFGPSTLEASSLHYGPDSESQYQALSLVGKTIDCHGRLQVTDGLTAVATEVFHNHHDIIAGFWHLHGHRFVQTGRLSSTAWEQPCETQFQEIINAKGSWTQSCRVSTITADRFDNTQGQFAASHPQGALTVRFKHLINDGGRLQTEGDWIGQMDSLDNGQGGWVQIGGNCDITVRLRPCGNAGGTWLVPNGRLTLRTPSGLNNRSGTLECGQLQFENGQKASIDNISGTIQVGNAEAQATCLSGQHLHNHNGQITITGALKLEFPHGEINNQQGTIQVWNTQDHPTCLSGQCLNNDNGQLSITGASKLEFPNGKLNNQKGNLRLQGQTSWHCEQVNNDGGIIAQTVPASTASDWRGSRFSNQKGILHLQSCPHCPAPNPERGTVLTCSRHHAPAIAFTFEKFLNPHGTAMMDGWARLNIGNWNNTSGFLQAQHGLSWEGSGLNNDCGIIRQNQSKHTLLCKGMHFKNEMGLCQSKGALVMKLTHRLINRKDAATLTPSMQPEDKSDKGVLRSHGKCILSAPLIDNSHHACIEQTSPDGCLTVRACELRNTDYARLSSNHRLRFHVTQRLNNTLGQITAHQQLQGEAPLIQNHSGILLQTGPIGICDVTCHTLINHSESADPAILGSRGDMRLTCREKLENIGPSTHCIAGETMAVRTPLLRNQNGAFFGQACGVKGKFCMLWIQQWINQAAKAYVGDDAYLQAHTLQQFSNASLESAGQFTLEIAEKLHNADSVLKASKQLSITVGKSVHNQGKHAQLSAGKSLTLSTHEFYNEAGSLNQMDRQGHLTLSVNHGENTQKATIDSRGLLDIGVAHTWKNDSKAVLRSARAVRLSSPALLNSDGARIEQTGSDGTLWIHTLNGTNCEKSVIDSLGNLRMWVNAHFQNDNSTIHAQGACDLVAHHLSNRAQGRIQTGTWVEVEKDHLQKIDWEAQATVTTGNLDANLSVATDLLDNRAGIVSAENHFQLLMVRLLSDDKSGLMAKTMQVKWSAQWEGRPSDAVLRHAPDGRPIRLFPKQLDGSVSTYDGGNGDWQIDYPLHVTAEVALSGQWTVMGLCQWAGKLCSADFHLTAEQIHCLPNSRLYAQAKLTLKATRRIENAGSLSAGKTLDLVANFLVKGLPGGKAVAGECCTITTCRFESVGPKTVWEGNTDLSIQATDHLRNGPGSTLRSAAGNVSLISDQVLNAQSAKIESLHTICIKTRSPFEQLTRSTVDEAWSDDPPLCADRLIIVSKGSRCPVSWYLKADIQTLQFEQGGCLELPVPLRAGSNQNITLPFSLIYRGIKPQTLHFHDTIVCQGSLEIYLPESSKVFNSGGIEANQNVIFVVPDKFGNFAHIKCLHFLSIQSHHFLNIDLLNARNIALEISKGCNGSGGRMYGNSIAIQAKQSFDNDRLRVPDEAFARHRPDIDPVISTRGRLGSLKIQTPYLRNRYAQIKSLGDLTLSADYLQSPSERASSRLDNQSGILEAEGRFTVAFAHVLHMDIDFEITFDETDLIAVTAEELQDSLTAPELSDERSELMDAKDKQAFPIRYQLPGDARTYVDRR